MPKRQKVLMLVMVAALSMPAASAADATLPVSGGAAGGATYGGMSRDGSRVFFTTAASLLPEDGDVHADIYQRKRDALRLITPGTPSAPVAYAGASTDGTHVFFTTSASLVAQDADAEQDVYERSGASTMLVSGAGAAPASFAGASSDGSRVFFTTSDQLASGDGDAATDVYQRHNGSATLISTGSANENAYFKGASADGQHVIFATRESLAGTDNDTHQVYGAQEDLYERFDGATSHVSVGDNEPQNAFFNAISQDGSRVFFSTIAGVIPADQDGFMDVYERSGGQTTIVSTAPGSNSTGIGSAHSATFGRMSADGSRVFFTTSEPMDAGDTDGGVYDVYERSGGVTSLVSSGDKSANASSASVSGVSEDGSHVFFRTSEQLVDADTDTTSDIYERTGGTTTLVSTGPTSGNGPASMTFNGAAADGSRVVFSTAESLVSADTDTLRDVYERVGGETKLVSTGPTDSGASAATYGGVSADGRRVAFSSDGAFLAGDANALNDVFLGIVGDPPVMTGAPSISGTGWKAGETVTAQPGQWTLDPTIEYAWLRCRTTLGVSCLPISGADAEDGNETYELTSADNGFRIRAFVLATNLGGTTKVVTSTSPVVGVPANIAPPSLSGRTRTGDLLTVDPGTWTPEPTSYEVQWLRCTSPYVASCVPITDDADEDGHDTTYQLVDADDAKRIRARVVAVNESGSSTASTTAATALVDKPTLVAAPKITGSPFTSSELVTDLGEWTGSPLSAHRVEWLRCSSVYLSHCTVIGSDTDDDAVYSPGQDDVGYRIRVRVEARNAAGSAPKSTSAPTAKVAVGTPAA